MGKNVVLTGGKFDFILITLFDGGTRKGKLELDAGVVIFKVDDASLGGGLGGNSKIRAGVE